jgi:hypothetical protein
MEVADTGVSAVSDPDELFPVIDPDELYIEEIKTNGRGCPADDPGSVETVISDDKKSFVILYRDMALEFPPGPKVKNMSCNAAVKLHIPNGYQVALATVNTRGYLYLEKGITARETSIYYFAGNPLGSYPHTTIKGPHDDFFTFSDNIPFESLVWSDCGTSAIFGINTNMNLNANANPDGLAIFTTDVTDAVFRTLVHWQIRAC